MDRITESYLKQFRDKFELDHSMDQSTQFEHFCNYSIIDPFLEESIDLDGVNVGTNGTIGIDGFAVVVNQKLFLDLHSLDAFLKGNSELSATIIFVQAKTSATFQQKELLSFGNAIVDFLGTEQKLAWTPNAKLSIKLVGRLLDDIAKLREKPTCHIFYVTLGKFQADPNLKAAEDETIRRLSDLNIFSTINVQLIDAAGIQNRYKKIGQAVVKSIEIENSLILPEIKGIKEAYLCYVRASDFVELIKNDDGELLQNVFNDNVRDFQGDNNVNLQIAATLQGGKHDAFLVLNNGITIICEKLETLRRKFTLSNFQIINGCQTSHVIYQNRAILSPDVFVSVKIICAESELLTSDIIWSTNNQTQVRKDDLLAVTKYQRLLEDFYAHTEGEKKLYYERRSKQYDSKAIPKTRIVDKTTQIKCIGSLYFDQPDSATRYFGSLFGELGEKIFQEDQKPEIYYLSAYALFRIEQLFRQKILEAKYKKIKYFLLMMLKFEVIGHKLSQLNSKEILKEVDELLKVLHDDTKLTKVMGDIFAKIETMNEDLSDVELSKSASFAKKCRDIYLTRRA